MKSYVLVLIMIGAICQPAQAATAKNYPYQKCFELAAKLHSVPLDLLLAVAATESNWDATARSKANAHGIMQIQWPGTAKHLGVKRVGELYNPCLNISLGARYLQELLDTFNQSELRALGAYNYGPTRIQASQQLPSGAKAYAAKVQSHRRAIKTGLVPKRLQPASSKQLLVFDSKLRANRIARNMRANIIGATIRVADVKAPASGWAVILDVGPSGLTSGDHVWLRNLGLKL